MRNKEKKQWAFLILGTAILMGSIVRLAPGLLSDFPLLDGGMFYAMIKDIQNNQFALPLYTSYNKIPFTYPFFSFYFSALISSVLKIPTLQIVQFLPGIITSLSIPAFYWMAKEVLQSNSKAALATLAFAFIPRTFSWFILGGGISRSFYELFLILAIASGYQLYTKTEKQRKYLLLTILFNSLVVLSHPEAILHAGTIGALLAAFFARDRQKILNTVTVGAGVLALTSIWWLQVLIKHGVAPFIAAAQTGGHSIFSFWGVLVPNYIEESQLTLYTVFAIVGIFWQIRKKDFFLIAWLITPFIIEPRSATAISAMPLAMLAGIGLSEIIIPTLGRQAAKNANNSDWTHYFINSKLLRAFLLYIIFISLVNAFGFSLRLSQIVVSQPDREAMQWIKENTENDAKFIVLTGSSEPYSDPVQEWFPALAERHSQNTIQGQEWILGKEFARFHEGLNELQACTEVSCLDQWAGEFDREYDYIYIHAPSMLGLSLSYDQDFDLVYKTKTMSLYKKSRP